MNKSSTPRLYFHGQFDASVATGNNAEEINIFNADTQVNKDPVHVFDMTQVQVIDPIQFETKSGQQVNLTMENDLEIVRILDEGRGGRGPNFNFQGANGTEYKEVLVAGADIAEGYQESELYGVPITTKGVIIDLNPLGGNIATQIFGDKLSIGISSQMICEDGKVVDMIGQMTGELQTSFSRWVWGNRLQAPPIVTPPLKGASAQPDEPNSGGDGDHQGSGFFQSLIAKESLKFACDIEPGGVLSRWQNVFKNDTDNVYSGLSVRFSVYHASVEIQGNNMVSTMSISGAISLQQSSQATTQPSGRYLIPPNFKVNSNDNSADAKANAKANAKLMGPLFVSINERSNAFDISWDMITTIPEINDFETKKDYGKLLLELVDGDDCWQLGSINYPSYNQTSYRNTSGVFTNTFPLPTTTDTRNAFKAAFDGPGVLRLVSQDTVAETTIQLEEEVLVVQCDQRCIYMNQGEPAISMTFQLLDRGKPKANTIVYVQQYLSNDFAMGFPSGSSRPVPQKDWFVGIPSAPPAPESTYVEITTDENGKGTFDISGNEAGVCVIYFNTDGPQDEPFNSLYGYYSNVRVLPEDIDCLNYTAAELTAPDAFESIIYPKVLRFYYLFYPVMRNYLNLNSEAAILDPKNGFYDSMALGATTPEEFRIAAEKYSYMPRTREISANKRQLLKWWYDLNVGKFSSKKQAFAAKCCGKKQAFAGDSSAKKQAFGN